MDELTERADRNAVPAPQTMPNMADLARLEADLDAIDGVLADLDSIDLDSTESGPVGSV